MENLQETKNISENKAQPSNGSNFGLYFIMFGSLVAIVGIIVTAYIQHH
jgi:hypothetical protein